MSLNVTVRHTHAVMLARAEPIYILVLRQFRELTCPDNYEPDSFVLQNNPQISFWLPDPQSQAPPR